MRIINNRRGGGSARAKTFAANVPLASGLLTSVSTFGLLTPVTYQKMGGSTNLTLASNGQISAAVALGAGATQSLTGTATGADGVVFPFTANLTGTVLLNALTLSVATATTGNVWSATINGRTAGSTITATSSDGTVLNVSGSTVSGTFTSAGSPVVTLTETLASASNSGRQSTANLTVTLSPTLGALGLSATSFTIGTATSGTITGATAGSAISATGLPAGLTIDGAARTWSYSGAGSAATTSITLTETLAGAIGSPRATNLNVTIAAGAPAAPTISLTTGNSQISIAYSANATNGSAITGFNLYAGASAGSLALLGFIPVASASPYIDTGLTNGVARFYAMSAVNAVGEGPLSGVQSATPSGVTLGALSLSNNRAQQGTASSGTIIGATAGSTISATGLPAGVTINSAARTWSYDGAGAAALSDIVLTETLASASNSGRQSTIRFKVGLPLKIAFEGDSYPAGTNQALSYAARWMAENPGVTTQNFSVAGARILASDNPTNNLMNRISTIAAFNPSHLVVNCMVNDTSFKTTGTDWLNQCFFPYVAAVRAAMPLVDIIWCTGLPTTTAAAPNQNSVRAVANPAIRAAVGNQIDGIIPYGTHPIIGVDSAASTTMWQPDGLHPDREAVRHMCQVVRDVLNPIVAGAGGNTPSLSLFSITDAPVSTTVNSVGRVSGMGLGVAAPVTVSGTGTFAVGTGGQGTTGTAMNGDVITTAVPTSASNSAAVNQTVVVGGTSRALSYTTGPASYTVPTQLSTTNKSNTVTIQAGNLSAIGSAGVSAIQKTRSTVSLSNGLFYVEARQTDGVGQGFLVITDDTPTNFQQPGSSAAPNAGATIFLNSSITITVNGQAAFSSPTTQSEFLTFPTLAAGEWVGIAFIHAPGDPDHGRFWVRTSAGWLNGNPERRDGGWRINNPPAALFAAGCPRDVNPVATNFGGSAYAYARPVGFRPFA